MLNFDHKRHAEFSFTLLGYMLPRSCECYHGHNQRLAVVLVELILDRPCSRPLRTMEPRNISNISCRRDEHPAVAFFYSIVRPGAGQTTKPIYQRNTLFCSMISSAQGPTESSWPSRSLYFDIHRYVFLHYLSALTSC